MRKISMAVTSSNGIIGFKLFDSKNNVIKSDIWKDLSSKELKKINWVTQNVPADQKIIGFKVSTAGNYISRFGWQLMKI